MTVLLIVIIVMTEIGRIADKYRTRLWLIPMFTALAMLPALFSAAFGGAHVAEGGSMIIFMALLPAINGPIDWFSLGITRKLVELVSREPEGRYAWFDIPVFGELLTASAILANVVVALLLAIIVALTTAGGAALFVRLQVWGHTQALFSATAIIRSIRTDPTAMEYWWIYAMMCWTLLPTAFHFTSFTGALFARVLKPIGASSVLAKLLNDADKKDKVAERVVATALPSLFLALVRAGPGLFALAFLVVDHEEALDVLHRVLFLVWMDAPRNFADWGWRILGWSLNISAAIESSTDSQVRIFLSAAVVSASITCATWYRLSKNAWQSTR